MSSPALPLDDIAYLARSANRVAVLERLAAGTASRAELHDEFEISQPTLGRLLDGFEARGWITCDHAAGRRYRLTPLGTAVADGLTDLLATVATTQKLRPVAERLPLEEMGVDLDRLAESTVTVPTETDGMAHMRREDELIVDADRVRFLCTSAYAPGIKAYRDRFVGGDQSLDAVITGDALDAAAADPQTARWVRELATADGVTLHRYEGTVAMMLGLIDEVASLVPLDDEGVPCAFVESTDDAIRAWVEREFERHRAAAQPVGPARIEEGIADD